MFIGASHCLQGSYPITLLWPGWGYADELDLSRSVRVYLYRPEVFADRYLGLGLPADRSLLQANLWYLRLDESARAQAGIEALASFAQANQVSGLDFTGHRTLTNGDLEILFQPPALATTFKLLKLKGTQTDDRAMATIGRMPGLRILEVSERVTDIGLPFLKSLKHLQALTVPCPGVTDKSLNVLSQFSRLRILNLRGSQISDAGLKQLAALPLRQLSLGSLVTDQGLQTLRAIRTLEQMDLQVSAVTRSGLAELTALPVHTLFLGPSFSDADITVLPKFKNLKRLDLSGARLTDASLGVLATLTQLEELAVTDTALTDKALASLSQLPKLRYLEISGTRISPKAFQSISGFPSLTVLSFSTPKKLSIGDIKPLGRLAHLHTIVVNRVALGRAIVTYLQRQPQARAWSWIPLAEAGDTTDTAVDEALKLASAADAGGGGGLRGVRGLPLIHETESSLDEVVPAVAKPTIQAFEENEKNFLGEFTVNSGPPPKTKKPTHERKAP